MGEAHLEDALRIQRERVARRTAAVERQLVATAAGRPLETPKPRRDQTDMHGSTLVAHLRVIVQTWRHCESDVPQQLSEAIRMGKKAVIAAAETEVSDA